MLTAPERGGGGGDMRLDRKQRQRLKREGYRLARETFDSDVNYERLVEIRDRLTRIDTELYGPPEQAASFQMSSFKH